MDGFEHGAQPRVCESVVPAGCCVALAQASADREYEGNVKESIEHCLLTG